MEYRGRLFDGYKMIHNGVICMENGEIVACGSEDLIHPSTKAEKLAENQLIVPELIDLQFNGFDEIDFRYPMPKDFAQRLEQFGLKGVVATAISSLDYSQFLANCLILDQSKNLLAIHFEGPLISVPGIHPKDCVRGLSEQTFFELIVETRKKFTVPIIVTLAPELVSADYCRNMAGIGNVFLSLGHSSANAEVVNRFLDEHPLVTHVFNAMGPIHHRSPGVGIEALIHTKSHICMVSDGIHVHPSMMNVVYRLKREKLAFVSDMYPRKSPHWPVQGDQLQGGQSSLLEQLPKLGQVLGIHWENLLKHVTSTPGRMIGLNHYFHKGYRGRPLVLQLVDNSLVIVKRLG